MREFPLFPERASAQAGGVDALYFFLVGVTVIMTVLIYLAVAYFAVRYRRRDPRYVPHPVHGSTILETTWSVVPFVVAMVVFAWGAKIYFDQYTPPKNALEIYITGKQWMWKAQHPEGQREINELHVPTGRPVKLTMTTQDVIHSFYIPAFRVKRDVIPGTYTSMWFTPTEPGRYRLFCAEYCGTQHSGMIGWVTVMEPGDYENWLSGGSASETMAQTGEKLFSQYGCASCHRTDAPGRCPPLPGVFGSDVLLRGGARVRADEQYIRESILNPTAKIVAGYEPIMPTYAGQLAEEDLLRLVAHIKSLGARGVDAGATEAGRTPVGAPGTITRPQGGISAQPAPPKQGVR